jgi:hypothetical protein
MESIATNEKRIKFLYFRDEHQAKEMKVLFLRLWSVNMIEPAAHMYPRMSLYQWATGQYFNENNVS